MNWFTAAQIIWANRKTIMKKALLKGLWFFGIPLVIFYLAYLFLFGWTFKVEQDLDEFTQNEAETTFTYEGEIFSISLQEINDVLYVNEENITTGIIKRISYGRYIDKAENILKLYASGILDVGDGDTLLLDNSDTEKILMRIAEDDKKKEKKSLKKYEWLSKVYDYDVHEETVYGEEGFPCYNDDGSIMTQIVKNDYPEWLPDDVWDDTQMRHWDIHEGQKWLYANDIRGETMSGDSEKERFHVYWQLICAILESTSSQGYSDWDETGDESMADFTVLEYTDMDGYYLNDATINQVVDDMCYDFEFWYNGAELLDESYYEYEDMEKIAYRLDLKEMEENPQVGDNAYIKKIPETAPNKISNIYETVTYNYEPVTDDYGAYICVGRRVTIDAVAFVDMMKSLLEEFDWDEFTEIVEHFPEPDGALAVVNQLRMIHEWQLETGEPYFVIAENEYCISVGCRLGTKLGKKLDQKDPPGWKPENGDSYLNGDFIFVWLDGGWYAISEGALADLSVSDNLSLSQIQKLLSYFATRYGNPKDGDLRDAAQGLYNWQQSGGGSITGYLAIWIAEGALTTKIGREHWNFGNYTAAAGEPYFYSSSTNKHKWLDVKDMYDGDISAAVVDQISRTARYYWQRGQNSYYAMCFNTTSGVYMGQEEGVEPSMSEWTHCYCPYWEDSSFTVTPTKDPNPAYRGWANNCAMYRKMLLSMI